MSNDEALEDVVLPSIICPCGELNPLQPGKAQVLCTKCGALLANVEWFATERSEAEA